MKAFFSKLYTFSYRFIQYFSLFLTALLFAANFLFTCYADNMETQQVLTKWDKPFENLFGIFLFAALFLFICAAACAAAKRFPKLLSNKVLLFLVFAWILFAGAVLIVFGKTVPAADAMSVYSAAEALSLGDTSVIHPTASYLSYYPQQIGLVAFYEGFFRLFHLLPFDLPAYHFIKCLYVLFACLIVLFQYKSVHLLWQSETADRFYLLLAGANLPLLMYTSFVYGEIPSFAAASIGFYCLLRLCGLPNGNRESSASTGPLRIPLNVMLIVLSVLFLALSVMLRKNSLILVIAALLTALFYRLHTRKNSLLVFALLCALFSFAILPFTERLYELRAGNSLKTGVPAISYFAMGMQEASRGNGWYNGFNFNTYQETKMDTEATALLSKEAISSRLSYFAKHPGYTFRFYLGKELSQWADGTYACRQATLATFGGRSPFFDSLYAGEHSRYMIGYCNAYQNMLYLGAVIFCIGELRRERRKEPGLSGLPVYLFLICVVGGFLFHTVWEANSRYIFTYGLLLLPYGAKGLADSFQRGKDFVNSTWRRRKSR